VKRPVSAGLLKRFVVVADVPNKPPLGLASLD